MAVEESSAGAAPVRRRPLLLVLLAAIVLANGFLLWPYARALWWLHSGSAGPAQLVLPVAGVDPARLEPTFGAPRAAGPHEGIDIPAPLGSPVLAAADGIIVGNRRTAIGGIVLWILGSGRRLYYYAHLSALAPGMHMGRRISAGETLGGVGTTGNAEHTPPHLHFAIYAVESNFYPLRLTAIDPYPLLTAPR